MSPHTESLSHRFETPPVTPSPHQEHLKRSHSNPNLLPEDHRSQDDTSSAHPQRLERPSSAQNLQSQGHQPQHIPFNKPSQLDSRSQRLGGKTVKQFEELARNFTEQETIEDIINWNTCLREQLKDEYLIAEYNAWSEEYLKPQPRRDSLWWKDLTTGFTKFKFCLQLADWNTDRKVDNRLIDFVFSTMLYCRRLRNRGLLMLGTFQRSWLTLRLHMWAISAQKTDPQLRELHSVADSQPEGVLGLRYKPIGKKSTAKVLFFFPLGYILHTEALKSDKMQDDDLAQWVDVIEWTDIPYILALGIQDNGKAEVRKGKMQFYFIHNPTQNSDISEDSDDDAQDIIFCRNPPPFTVARVKELPKEFLSPQISSLRLAERVDLEPLSLSTPEIVATSTKKHHEGYVRFGLFPEAP